MNRRVNPRPHDPNNVGRRKVNRKSREQIQIDLTGIRPMSDNEKYCWMIAFYVFFVLAAFFFWYEILFVGINWFHSG
jgi:hypothetical protein